MSRLAVVGHMSMQGLSVAKYSAPRSVVRPGRSLMSMNALFGLALEIYALALELLALALSILSSLASSSLSQAVFGLENHPFLPSLRNIIVAPL